MESEESGETGSARRRRERLSARSRLLAESRIESHGLPSSKILCGAFGGKTRDGKTCTAPAGANTPHVGTGLCRQHGGLRRDELATGAWVMGHALAKSLDVSPWDALLGEVRRTAGKVAWLDWKLGTYGDDAEFVGDGQAVPWVRMQEKERTHLARVSKMAIDAGVAAIMVQQVQAEVSMMARALNAALDALGLTEEQDDVARSAMHRELMRIEGERQGGVPELAGVDYQGDGFDG